MNHRSILDSWVNYLVKEWLDKREKLDWLEKAEETQLSNATEEPTSAGGKKKDESQFPPSVQQLILKLRKYASDSNHIDDAWHCIEQMEKLSDHIHRENNMTSARMFLECGVAAYRMGNSHESISFLTRATSSYAEDHDKGIAYWLLGCVYWYINNPINALGFWEDGYHRFCEQRLKSGRGTSLEQWYEEKIEEMKAAITYAAEHEAPHVPSRPTMKKSVTTKQHILQTLPVIGQIPAGTPLNILPSPADFINMERVHIGDKDYCFVSLLRGEKIVNLPQRGQFYYLLRVSGNSMNKCSAEPIGDGDYVIMREQYIADNGDIVAALIIKSEGEDSQATLKRYVVRDWRIFLQPESDDPEFQKPVYSQSFTNPNDEFQIRGVAIAVLKPL